MENADSQTFSYKGSHKWHRNLLFEPSLAI